MAHLPSSFFEGGFRRRTGPSCWRLRTGRKKFVPPIGLFLDFAVSGGRPLNFLSLGQTPLLLLGTFPKMRVSGGGL